MTDVVIDTEGFAALVQAASRQGEETWKAVAKRVCARETIKALEKSFDVLDVLLGKLSLQEHALLIVEVLYVDHCPPRHVPRGACVVLLLRTCPCACAAGGMLCKVRFRHGISPCFAPGLSKARRATRALLQSGLQMWQRYLQGLQANS